MVLGRKALAYTSKTPGKTQQYNYFVLNEPSGHTSPSDADRASGHFYVVDMPGLGYAKVLTAPSHSRQALSTYPALAAPHVRLETWSPAKSL